MSYQAMKTWRQLKCKFLSDRGQSEKTTYCIITTIWCSRKGNAMETVKKFRSFRVLRVGT